MAGVYNNSARIFNVREFAKPVKGKKTGNIITVRIAPKFNVFPDEHWNAVKGGKFVQSLVKSGDIEYGEKVDDLELEGDPETNSVSSSIPVQESIQTTKTG